MHQGFHSNLSSHPRCAYQCTETIYVAHHFAREVPRRVHALGSRPPRADETHVASVPRACPDCRGIVEVTHETSQHQEDIRPRPLRRARLQHRGRPLFAVFGFRAVVFNGE